MGKRQDKKSALTLRTYTPITQQITMIHAGNYDTRGRAMRQAGALPYGRIQR